MVFQSAKTYGSRVSGRLVATLLVGLVAGSAAYAQDVSFDLPEPECLPLEENKVFAAGVDGVAVGDSVRLYFRRLSRVGDFYYLEMTPSAADAYWTTFPRAEEREQEELNDSWWEDLQHKDWMEGHDREWLEDFLEDQRFEAAEYYVAVLNAAGELRAESKTELTTVMKDDCFEPLDPIQRGWSDNLAIGETADVQAGKEVFHWLCHGIVTRIDPYDVRRPDEYCRACVLGLWIAPTSAAGIALIGGGLIETQVTGTVPPQATALQP